MIDESQNLRRDYLIAVIYTLRLQMIVSIFNILAVERAHDRYGYELAFQEGGYAQCQPQEDQKQHG